MTIPAVHNWPTNGHLIADVAALYFTDVETVFDATYGRGKWWTQYKPEHLITNDLYSEKADHHCDFRMLGNYIAGEVDAVAYDPPYKLNGTPALTDFDNRYGVDVPMSWQDKMLYIRDGFFGCADIVAPGGYLLAKCQDQVCSGAIRWQTHMLYEAASGIGFDLIDRFDILGGGRPQPKGRTQRHAYGRGSTLLVFQNGEKIHA